jgi:hypothetical protein
VQNIWNTLQIEGIQAQIYQLYRQQQSSGIISGDMSFIDWQEMMRIKYQQATEAVDAQKASVTDLINANKDAAASIQDEIDALEARNKVLREQKSLEDDLYAIGKTKFDIDTARRKSMAIFTAGGRSAREDLPGLYERYAQQQRDLVYSTQINSNNDHLDILKAQLDKLDEIAANTSPDGTTSVSSSMPAWLQVSHGPGTQQSMGASAGMSLGGGFGTLGAGGSEWRRDPISGRAYMWFGHQSHNTGGGFALPGRANGGSVMPGRDYIVGERGPEVLRMGNSGGYVQPNGAGQFIPGVCTSCHTVYTIDLLNTNPLAKQAVRRAGTK